MQSNKELYIDPSFFSSRLSREDVLNFDLSKDNLDINKIDMYSLVKKDSHANIVSMFKNIRYIPLSNGRMIDYESDSWDFSGYSIINRERTVINFQNVTEGFKGALKDHTLLLILKGDVKFTTIKNSIKTLKRFTEYLNKHLIEKMEDITSLETKSFLAHQKVTQATLNSYIVTIRKFLIMYDAEHGTEIYDILTSKVLKNIDARQLKAQGKNNQRNAIPDEYFNRLLKVLIWIMDDESKDSLTRAYAAIFVLDSQTGIRASELSLLEVDAVESFKTEDTEYKMLHYKVTKTVRGSSTGYKEEITYINALSDRAYRFLVEIFKENRKERNSKFLFCPEKEILPVNVTRFMSYLKRFCIYYGDVIGSLNEKYKSRLSGKIELGTYIKNYHISPKDIDSYPSTLGLDRDTMFYFPVVHQFRHTVVDRLLRANVPLEVIRRYMGHLSQQMTDSYASYKDTDIQENINFSESVLHSYIVDKDRILGNSGDKIMQKIDEYIKENNFNVYEDFEKIIDNLLKKIPIRAKAGGMCIKGGILSNACSVDSLTDEFYCAYGLCPNICHFYYHMDMSLMDFRENRKIYLYNKDNGLTSRAKQEMSKINFILNSRLLPELRELEKVLETKTKEDIVLTHPNMEYILNNLDDIKGEIREWESMMKSRESSGG